MHTEMDSKKKDNYERAKNRKKNKWKQRKNGKLKPMFVLKLRIFFLHLVPN